MYRIVTELLTNRVLFFFCVQIIWNNKANLTRLTKFIASYVGRFSTENLKEFKNHDAALFNAEINFEVDDIDRLEEVLFIHTRASMVSSTTQLISMIILAEGAKGT